MSKRTAQVLGLSGEAVGEIELPQVFNTPLRPDVIKKAVITIQSHRYQPQGRDPYAGKRTTAESMGVGHGIARLARLKGGRRAAFVVGTVGGHTAFPPRVDKNLKLKMNRKENRLAILSGIAATADKQLVLERGHSVESVKELPLIIEDAVQGLGKTKEVKELMVKTGVWQDILRTSEKKIRAGKGKMRSRRVKRRVGPLIVVSEDLGLSKAAGALPGVDVVEVKSLNAELLAPGAHPGRLTLWTQSAISMLDELFKVKEE